RATATSPPTTAILQRLWPPPVERRSPTQEPATVPPTTAMSLSPVLPPVVRLSPTRVPMTVLVEATTATSLLPAPMTVVLPSPMPVPVTPVGTETLPSPGPAAKTPLPVLVLLLGRPVWVEAWPCPPLPTRPACPFRPSRRLSQPAVGRLPGLRPMEARPRQSTPARPHWRPVTRLALAPRRPWSVGTTAPPVLRPRR